MYTTRRENFFELFVAFVKDDKSFSYLKSFKSMSGIYCICNIATNEYYVGQSIDLYKRIGEHIRKLRNGEHKYTHGGITLLQKAWNEYGENNFRFRVLETCEKELLDEKEKFWIDYYQSNYNKHGKGYNYNKGGSATFKKSERKTNKDKIVIHNDEIQKVVPKEELEEYKKLGYVRGFSPKNKHKIFKDINKNRDYPTGENHPLHGIKLTEEHRQKLSDSHKGHKLTKEQIEKRTETNIKNGNILAVCQFDLDGNFIKEYDNAEDVKRKTGYDSVYVRNCCKGKHEKAYGYVWKFKKDCMDMIDHEYPNEDRDYE